VPLLEAPGRQKKRHQKKKKKKNENEKRASSHRAVVHAVEEKGRKKVGKSVAVSFGATKTEKEKKHNPTYTKRRNQ
jgi:hypothetical protein